MKADFRGFVDLYPFEQSRMYYAQFDVTWDDGTTTLEEVKFRDRDKMPTEDDKEAVEEARRQMLEIAERRQQDKAREEQERAALEQAEEEAKRLQLIESLDFDMLDDSGKAITGSVLIRDRQTGRIITRIADYDAVEVER